MQPGLSLGTAILLIGTTWMGAGTALARESCFTPGAWKPTPQERIVQRDIQEAIDQGLEEREAKDIQALSRQIPPDFTLRLLDGTTLNREQSLEGIRQDLQTVLHFDADRSKNGPPSRSAYLASWVPKVTSPVLAPGPRRVTVSPTLAFLYTGKMSDFTRFSISCTLPGEMR